MKKEFLVRRAMVSDCVAMHNIIKTHAADGLMRPKSIAQLQSLVLSYIVAVVEGEVIGLCGMKIWPGEGVEIISSAVINAYHGKGVGKAMNEAIIEIASSVGFERFFILTKQPDFYSKLNFVEIPKTSLGQKVYSDCIDCPENISQDPRKIQCSDVAMELTI